MKVLHVISPSIAGSIESVGASWSAIMLCNEMVHDSRVTKLGIATKLDDYSKVDKNIEVHEIEVKPRRINKDIVEEAIKVYDEHGYEVMHVHVHSLSVIKWLAKLIPDYMKVVFTLHTPTMLGRSSVEYGEYGYRITNKDNFQIVAPSNYMKTIWCKFIGEKLELSEMTNVSTVYNGTTSEKLETVPQSEREDYFFVCCRIDAMKRVLETLRALDKLGQKTIFVGNSWRNKDKDKVDLYADQVVELIEKSKYIIWIKKASNTLVKEYMRYAKALVTFSNQESFGLTASESLSVGTPIVYCEGGALEEVLSVGKTGIKIKFPYRSTWNTREKLVKVALDDISSGKFTYNPMELVKLYEDNYTINKMSNGYLDCYKKLVK